MKSYFSKSSHVEKEDNSILSDIAKDPLRTGNGIHGVSTTQRILI